MSDHSNEISRRHFLKGTAVTAGGLVIGFHLFTPFENRAAAAGATTTASAAPVYPPNAFIQIAPDNSVTFVINKIEMGQGVFTSMAQLIAEELDCNWKDVHCIHSPVNPVYNHTAMPFQLTGGSTALASSYDQHRKIGAQGRQMLMTAAAQKWGVDVSSLSTDKGYVIHSTKGRVAYGEISEAAIKLPLPTDVKLKNTSDFGLIGKSIPRVDAYEKSTGKAIFGLDVRLPGMVYAVVLRPPVFGATLKDFDAADAKKVSGVSDVIRVDNRIFVIGRNSWAARQGRDALKANWDLHGKDQISHTSLMNDLKTMSDKPGLVAKSATEAIQEIKQSKHVLDAEYHFPYLAHAAMEPLNCTVDFDGKTANIYAGHQAPGWDQAAAAKILGIAPDKISVHTTYAGGGFGRRGNQSCDFTIEAAGIAKVLKKPVKVTWTREDDMTGGYYRPMAYHRARITTDEHGHPKAWHHTIVSQSIMAGGPLAVAMAGGVDPTVTEGVSDTKYAVPKMHLDLAMPTWDIPVLWFRSVGHTHTDFVMETLIDEMATNAKKDALEFRKSLLKNQTRHLAVLDLLKKTSPWGKPAPKGHAYGLALAESFNTVVGHVIEVSKVEGQVKVHNVWSAVHCGRVVNPTGARTQVEGAIAFGISKSLYGEVEIANGRVMTTNFHNYPVIRMNEMPQIHVAFVESTENPTGLGEPGVPPVGPAIANALHHLTGKRLRSLPLKLS